MPDPAHASTQRRMVTKQKALRAVACRDAEPPKYDELILLCGNKFVTTDERTALSSHGEFCASMRARVHPTPLTNGLQ